jgi:hypothetical protein
VLKFTGLGTDDLVSLECCEATPAIGDVSFVWIDPWIKLFGPRSVFLPQIDADLFALFHGRSVRVESQGTHVSILQDFIKTDVVVDTSHIAGRQNDSRVPA